MTNKVIIAVAGAGKTDELASLIAAEPNPRRVLVLTYTERNQREIAARVALKTGGSIPSADVMGWMAFLLNQIVRPYLPAHYPGTKLRGLGKDPESFRGLSGSRWYLNRNGDAYPGHLAKLAVDTIRDSHSAPISRLESIYDAVYIDETQDLCANDLVILEKLFKSDMRTTLVLDPRQAVLQTTERDSKYPQYKRTEIALFFKDLERRGKCQVEERVETHRFIPEIAAFSDAVIPARLGFKPTASCVEAATTHTGIFIVAKSDLRLYASQIGATILRNSITAGIFEDHEAINFGECKGITRDHVLIIATDTIEKALKGNKDLEGKALCGFYVAITRARYSVAIAVEKPEKVIASMRASGSRFAHINIRRWSPCVNE